MIALAKRIKELGEECGMTFRLVDENGIPYDGDIDFEIPSLILALSRATGSRSSTVVEGVQITALHMDNLREKCYLIVVGEFLEDNSYRLLKTIVESYEVEL
ncbi:hypothetical protein Theba_0522 [Mesotoga prima MesG1.Ag.4.2]|uniref:Uncharacterized protein n=1 Tax=Mesotoga prima MesG1.Ag.4.2 TaxID=660470 RepID=I2F2U2_9BACT|nr:MULTISPECIES: hypothetical protein [Mesotoga]AFK06245.1 hypothetical protein Theba_0522 [Mesotoga prima MesG1.Ag.4.2]PIJ62050.1 hypothetical protein V513_05410 [Mesotoga sp. H07.pep.5.3]